MIWQYFNLNNVNTSKSHKIYLTYLCKSNNTCTDIFLTLKMNIYVQFMCLYYQQRKGSQFKTHYYSINECNIFINK